MTKAEQENHRAEYHRLLDLARGAERTRDYRKALLLAVECLPHIDGMMRFEQKYEEREFESVAAIDLILEYVPLLLHCEALDALSDVLKSKRRIDREAKDDLGERVRVTRNRMWAAYATWDELERPSGALANDRVTRNHTQQTEDVLLGWHRVGLVRGSAKEGFSLTTQLDANAHGKCAHCGAVARAQKRRFLASIKCPKCQTSDLFTLLPRGRDRGEAS